MCRKCTTTTTTTLATTTSTPPAGSCYGSRKRPPSGIGTRVKVSRCGYRIRRRRRHRRYQRHHRSAIAVLQQQTVVVARGTDRDARDGGGCRRRLGWRQATRLRARPHTTGTTAVGRLTETGRRRRKYYRYVDDSMILSHPVTAVTAAQRLSS